MIYKDEKGQKYIALSDEDLENLNWNPKKLLELDHDGVGWIVRPASTKVARYLPNGIETDKVR
jgi:bifunctional DNA-binding transcriptional regulator/antitoxin component of YhaV-PrlF toxin-antitoxin module